MYVKSLFIKHNKFYINIYIISFEKKCIKIAFSVGQGGGGARGVWLLKTLELNLDNRKFFFIFFLFYNL